MAKHTPGPWHFFGKELRTSADMGRELNLNGWIVPIFESINGTKYGDPMANARLIAAAPELFRMLDQLAYETNYKGEVAEARAILAKIEGAE